MKVAIIGSRDFKSYKQLEQAINESGFKITEVISGGANGTDSLAELWALNHKVKCTVYEAEWDNIKKQPCSIKTRKDFKGKTVKYNALAGFNRNTQIIDRAEAVIAIQFIPTPGTQDSIAKAKKKGIPIFIFPNETKDFNF